MKQKEKIIYYFLIVWAAIQILRWVAYPIVEMVIEHKVNEAWMFPALLDMVTAFMAMFAVYFLMRKRSFNTWVFLMAFILISIIDHVDGGVVAILSDPPPIFGFAGKTRGEVTFSVLIPCLPDLLFLYFLFLPVIKNKLFKINTDVE